MFGKRKKETKSKTERFKEKVFKKNDEVVENNKVADMKKALVEMSKNGMIEIGEKEIQSIFEETIKPKRPEVTTRVMGLQKPPAPKAPPPKPRTREGLLNQYTGELNKKFSNWTIKWTTHVDHRYLNRNQELILTCEYKHKGGELIIYRGDLRLDDPMLAMRGTSPFDVYFEEATQKLDKILLDASMKIQGIFVVGAHYPLPNVWDTPPMPKVKEPKRPEVNTRIVDTI